jgi:hypothetical protein
MAYGIWETRGRHPAFIAYLASNGSYARQSNIYPETEREANGTMRRAEDDNFGIYFFSVRSERNCLLNSFIERLLEGTRDMIR